MTPELEALEKLEPCPFCKGTQIELQPTAIDRLKRYACAKCLAYGPPKYGSELAGVAWNTRASQHAPALIERYKRMEEALQLLVSSYGFIDKWSPRDIVDKARAALADAPERDKCEECGRENQRTENASA